MESLAVMMATGGGLGYVPGLPGTAGAAAGLLFAVGLARVRAPLRVGAVVMLVLVAVPVCEYGARAFGGDDTRIVADELLTFPVATAALPVTGRPMLLAGVFVASRILDGLKPPPARVAESLHGGVGIVLDDVVANAWTLLLGLLAWRIRRRLRGE